MKTLAARLKLAMDKRGITKQADLMRACHVSSASVADWFSGKTRSLGPETARLAAEFLRCDRDWLGSGRGLPGWWEDDPSNAGKEFSMAHTLSVVAHRVERPISWETVVELGDSLPEEFTAIVPDDALAPSTPKGTMFVFNRNAAPTPRKAIIVSDGGGLLYLRRYAQDVGGRWIAQATNDGYASLESERDKLTILAVATWRSGGDA